MTDAARLNERAAKARRGGNSLWHVDAGWAFFAGPLGHNDSHAHSTAVYLAGLYGTFRLRVAGSGWVSCRSAVIRAGTPYEFDVGGDPLGVFYLEPSIDSADALAPLVGGGEEVNGALVGSGDGSPMRAHYERRSDVASMRAGMLDVIDFAQRSARRRIDQRIAAPSTRCRARRRCIVRDAGCGLVPPIVVALPAPLHPRGRRPVPPLPRLAPAACRHPRSYRGQQSHHRGPRGRLCRSGAFHPRVPPHLRRPAFARSLASQG